MARREIQEINAGSMADIAFLLLIFFLVATTMDIDTGISRLLPAMPDEEEMDSEQEIRERNIFVVLINRDDQLFVEKEIVDVSRLKEMTKEFVVNPGADPVLSEKREADIDFFGRIMVSKGIISLQSDMGTSYGKYIEVQNELLPITGHRSHPTGFNRHAIGISYLNKIVSAHGRDTGILCRGSRLIPSLTFETQIPVCYRECHIALDFYNGFSTEKITCHPYRRPRHWRPLDLWNGCSLVERWLELRNVRRLPFRHDRQDEA